MKSFTRWKIILIALVPATLSAQRQCKKGIPCGGTCIAANKTCRVGAAATPAPAQRGASALATATATDSATSAGEWAASNAGHTYYKADCSAAKRLAAKNRIYFKTEAEAKKAGYSRSRSKGC